MTQTPHIRTAIVAEHIVAAMKRHGIQFVFGYPGEQSILLHRALIAEPDIRFVMTRHEQSAAYAALGYAHANESAGVCVVGTGASATNIVTAILNAKMDSQPLVVLAAQVATTKIGADVPQEADIVGATLPLVKHSYLVNDAEKAIAIINEAFELAVRGRPGPVLVSVPVDVLAREVTIDHTQILKRRSSKMSVQPAQTQIKKALSLLVNADRPLILLGGGVSNKNGSQAVLDFVEKTGFPVVATCTALGCIPIAHEFYVGLIGKYGSVAANIAVNQADVLFAVGTRFDERTTGPVEYFAPLAKVIHVDVDASEINKQKPSEIPIQGDAVLTIRELTDAIGILDISAWYKQIDKWKRLFDQAESLHGHDEFNIRGVLHAVQASVKPDTHVVTSAGLLQSFVQRAFPWTSVRQLMSTYGLSTRGFGLGSSIGVQLAKPDQMVLCIESAPNMLMNIQELHTMATLGLPVKMIVINSSHFGFPLQISESDHEAIKPHLNLGHTQFTAVANAFGCRAVEASNFTELADALRLMKEHAGPFLIEVNMKFEGSQVEQLYPMIPDGKTYLDTLLPGGRTLRDVIRDGM